MKIRETLRKKAKGKKGFTLVELVIVIAVLAIIAAIAIPTVTNVIGNANTAADQSNAQSIELAIKTAKAETAANVTNPSTRVTALGTGGTLDTLLATYGVSSGVLATPKVSSDKFWYSKTSGKVVANTADPDASGSNDWLQLVGGSGASDGHTTYTISGDTLKISLDT